MSLNQLCDYQSRCEKSYNDQWYSFQTSKFIDTSCHNSTCLTRIIGLQLSNDPAQTGASLSTHYGSDLGSGVSTITPQLSTD